MYIKYYYILYYIVLYYIILYYIMLYTFFAIHFNKCKLGRVNSII